MASGFNKAFEGKLSDLVALIDVTPQLLFKLRDTHVITREHVKELETLSNDDKRAYKLLDVLSRRSDKYVEKFCDVLVAFDQQNVVDLLKSSAGGKTESSHPKQGHAETGTGGAAGSTPRIEAQMDTTDSSRDAENSSRPAEADPKRLACWPKSGNEKTEKEPKPQLPTKEFVARVRERIRKNEAYDIPYNPGDSAKRGRAVTIANEIFSKDDRLGTEVDIEKLERLWNRLNFDVKTMRNLSAEAMKRKCREESESAALQNSAVFVLCILSHGDEDVVSGIDDDDAGNSREAKIEDLLEYFDGANCKALIGKPKLFFVQACRGDRTTEGFARADNKSSKTASELPRHEKADRILVLSTCPGYLAFRHEITGSYFIDALTKAFESGAHEKDFNGIMNEVEQRMHSTDIPYEDESKIRNLKQLCERRSVLDKDIYLLPYQ